MSNGTEISILIDEQKYTGWKRVSISRSIESLAGTFSIALTDVWEDKAWDIFPGRSCVISMGQERLITGYVDKVRPRISAEAHEFAVTGRCKTADLVDCSVSNEPAKWTNIKTIALIESLCEPFGIKVETQVLDLAVISEFSVKSGETVHNAIRRICDMQGVLPVSGTEGQLIITQLGQDTASEKLVYGQNIKEAEGDYDYANRYSVYTVKGQKSGGGSSWAGGSSPSTQVVGTSTDDQIERFRPYIIRADRQATSEYAQTRAYWEANVRAARSEKAKVTVPTWRQAPFYWEEVGQRWKENLLVETEIRLLRIVGTKLVTRVDYTSDDTGMKADLTLMREDAFTPKPSKPPPQAKGLARWW
jgi:prophage tail gpP-like protein